MKKILHPTYGFLLAVIFAFLFILDVSISVAVWIPSVNSPLFWSPIGIAIALIFLYLLYGIADFSWRTFNEYGGVKGFWLHLKEEELFRKVVSSYIGSFLNLAMSIIYFVEACLNRSLFDLLAAQYLFSGFVIRALLLYITFYRKKNWELRGLRLSSIFTIFFGAAMLSLTFVYNFLGVVIVRDYFLTTILGIYSLAKIVTAIASLREAVHNKDLTFLSYTIIAMSLAFYTLFMFFVTVPVSESAEEVMPRDAFIGYLLSAVTIVVGVLCLLHYRRLKESLPEQKIIEETVIEEIEGVLEEKDGNLQVKTPTTIDKKVVKIVKKNSDS